MNNEAMKSERRTFGERARKSGNAVLLSVLLLFLLAALASAQFTVVYHNSRSSSFLLMHSDLHKYAECGIDFARHDLAYKISGKDGNIGTENWKAANDVGRDGQPSTFDEGEGDGIPTPGEPNVNPVPIGSANLGGALAVWVSDTAFPNVKRAVATAVSSNSGTMATVDTFILRTEPTVPRVGAIYVDPAVALDLNGNSFLIDGRDHSLDGKVLATGAMKGISTDVGDPPGSNQVALLSQMDAKSYDQVLGDGGMPSLGETSEVSLDALADSFKSLKTKDLAPGTYSSAALGSIDKMEVTYVTGDLHLSGKGTGAGVLVVDGSLAITGQFLFHGLVITRGDIKISGGGSGIHVLGSVMVGQNLLAIDPLSDAKVGGNADVFYCSEILQRLNTFLNEKYSVVYYDDK